MPLSSRRDRLEYNRKWREKNRAKYEAYMKEYTAKNADRLSTFRKKKYANDPRIKERISASARLRDNGWTDDEYKAALIQQNRACFLCKRPESKNRALAADHCQKTGQKRALLCSNCNRGLGHFKDDFELLRATALYVEFFAQKARNGR